MYVWDTEITDSLGNLLENDHLCLYDYLLYKLKERNIKIMLTPIAFWANLGAPRIIPLQRQTAYDYQTEVPAEVTVSGMLNYRIIIQKPNEEYFVFPGNYNSSP